MLGFGRFWIAHRRCCVCYDRGPENVEALVSGLSNDAAALVYSKRFKVEERRIPMSTSDGLRLAQLAAAGPNDWCCSWCGRRWAAFGSAFRSVFEAGDWGGLRHFGGFVLHGRFGAQSHLRARGRGRIGDAFDLGVPTLAFALAPGSATFGAYFALWHSPRHLALAIERYATGESLGERVATFARAALPNTLIALGASIPLVAFAGASRRESVDGLILAVTVPHSVSVAMLEASAKMS